MPNLFAQPIGGLGITTGPEGAFVQPVDGRRIGRRLGQDGEGDVVHRAAA
jgi:hypothetical protein